MLSRQIHIWCQDAFILCAACLSCFACIQAETLKAESELLVPTSSVSHEYRLFDGRSLTGWQNVKNLPISQGWNVDDEAIHRKPVRDIKVGHLYWKAREFGDFQLSWQWKISPGGNSGVKYRVFSEKGRWLGFEYQLLDDQRHPNASDPKKTTGALYGLFAPEENKRLHPVGQYNSSRVVARGSQIEHWLNGVKILEVDTSSEQWRSRVARSKFNEFPRFGRTEKGKILLQDHGHEVWFRNIAILTFDDEP